MVDAETGIATWYTEPAGVVTQLGALRILSLAMTQYIANTLHPRAREHFGRKNTYALHDWSTLGNFDFDARAHLVNWCIKHRNEFVYTGVAHPPLSAFWKMAVVAGKAAMCAGGCPFEAFSSLEDGICAFRLRPLRRFRGGPDLDYHSGARSRHSAESANALQNNAGRR